MKYLLTTLFVCISLLASAQSVNGIQILDAMINKIEKSRSISYESLMNEKNIFGLDTLNRHIKGTAFLDSSGKIASSEFFLKQKKYKSHQIFTNNKIYSFETNNSYSVQNRDEYISSIGDLFGPGGILAVLKKAIIDHKNIFIGNDTLINKLQCNHLEIIALDSIIEKENVFTRISIYIDKNNMLPIYTIFKGHNVVSKDNFKIGSYDIYCQAYYKKIRLNKVKNNYLINFKVPSKYHLAKENKLLEKGTIAPFWKKLDLNGDLYSSKKYKENVSFTCCAFRRNNQKRWFIFQQKVVYLIDYQSIKYNEPSDSKLRNNS